MNTSLVWEWCAVGLSALKTVCGTGTLEPWNLLMGCKTGSTYWVHDLFPGSQVLKCCVHNMNQKLFFSELGRANDHCIVEL